MIKDLGLSLSWVVELGGHATAKHLGAQRQHSSSSLRWLIALSHNAMPPFLVAIYGVINTIRTIICNPNWRKAKILKKT